jgi:hypothetical protein
MFFGHSATQVAAKQTISIEHDNAVIYLKTRTDKDARTWRKHNTELLPPYRSKSTHPIGG